MAFSLPPSLRTASGATRAIIALAIPASALALGSLHTPVLCFVAGLLAVGVFVGWYDGTPYRSRLPATVLVFTAIGLTAFTALQALPLPAPLVRLVAPATADVWSRALSPLGAPGPALATLSLDPIATRVEILRGVVYLSAFLLALRIADRHGGTTYLSMLIVITSCVLAAASILHPMFGLHRVFGVYEPTDAIQARHIAPLLNPNHLGAYLNIGFCLALGMVVSRRHEAPWPIVVAMALVLGMTQVWVGSRGATLAMILGAVVVILTARLSRRFVVQSLARLVLPTIVIAAGAGMIVLGLSQDASSELGSLDVGKTKIALEGLHLVPTHAVFGIGRGAFQAAFPAVRQTLGYFSVTHPENIVVQWITEWGLPVAVAGAAALVYALRPQVLIASSSPAVGAWAALMAVALQNLVDFSSEVPAIAIACAVCAAMIVTGRGSTRSGRLHSWAMHPRRVAFGIAAATLVTIVLALPFAPHELETDRLALYRDISEPIVPADFSDEVRAALLRHPSEPYLAFVGAVGAARRGQSAIPWVERALELSPIYAPAHFILAQQIARFSPSQSRLEFRLAISQTAQDDALDSAAAGYASNLVSDFDSALEVVPDGKKRVWTLRTLSSNLRVRLPSTSTRIDELIRRLDPNDREPIERVVTDTLTDLDARNAAPWCAERTDCTQPALAAATRLIALEPSSCRPLVLRARLLVAADDAPRGLHDLEVAAQTATDSIECWRALGELGAQTKSETYVTLAETEVARAGCASDDECTNNELWIANLEQQRGNARGALMHFQRALESEPDRVDVLRTLADMSASLNLHAQAKEAYERLARVTGDGSFHAQAQQQASAMARNFAQRELNARDAGIDLNLLDGVPPLDLASSPR